MTQTELYDSHCHIPDFANCRELSVKASIEYAISVLEELKTKWEPVEFAHNFSLILESKIAGLKELIK